jgi:N-methylhydantoinase A
MRDYFCGIDIGGTFTDCVAVDRDAVVAQAKTPTTPADLSEGFFRAIAGVAEQYGLGERDFLERTELLLHGTTVGTNLVVEMDGAKIGLVTTRGHADVLAMMRSAGRSIGLSTERLLHVSRHRKPEPIVPRGQITEVTERVDWDGDIVVPLHAEEAEAAVEELLAQGVEAIAVSFLWGFANPVHELAVKEMILARAPETFVSCGHEVAAVVGEYERTVSTVINAYIGPRTSSYLRELVAVAGEKGYANPLLIMQAAGGVATAEAAAEAPLFTIGSGPAGGIAGVAYLARQLGHNDVIAGDMGGTSFDVGIIHDGRPRTAQTMTLDQYQLHMPRLEIESIGSGGGSLIWAEELSRTLRVGPESAGAVPGPACYGRGGERPTVTDADVVLGYYGDATELSGGIRLDRAAAGRAIGTVATELGLSTLEVAAGAVRIVDHQMAGLMRQLTIEKGLDPRDFVVYSYGGAAALHAAEFTRELGAKRVVIPLGNLASGWSALGVLGSDFLHVHEKAEHMQAPFDAERLNAAFEELEATAREELAAEEVSDEDVSIERFVDMKFPLQIHKLEVAAAGGNLDAAAMEEQVSRYFAEYEAQFGAGTAFAGAGIELTAVRIRARGRSPVPDLVGGAAAGGNSGSTGTRDAYFPHEGAFLPAAVYDGGELGEGAEIAGPAIVEYPSTMVLVHPADTASVDRLGNLTIELGERPAAGGSE